MNGVKLLLNFKKITNTNLNRREIIKTTFLFNNLYKTYFKFYFAIFLQIEKTLFIIPFFY
jgi:hypothetical protein